MGEEKSLDSQEPQCRSTREPSGHISGAQVCCSMCSDSRWTEHLLSSWKSSEKVNWGAALVVPGGKHRMDGEVCMWVEAGKVLWSGEGMGLVAENEIGNRGWDLTG